MLCIAQFAASSELAIEGNITTRNFFLPSPVSGTVKFIATSGTIADPDGGPVVTISSPTLEQYIGDQAREILGIDHALEIFGYLNEDDIQRSIATYQMFEEKILRLPTKIRFKSRAQEAIKPSVEIPADIQTALHSALNITPFTQTGELLKLWRQVQEPTSTVAKVFIAKTATALPDNIRSDMRLSDWVYEAVRQAAHSSLGEMCSIDDTGLGRRKLYPNNLELMGQVSRIELHLPPAYTGNSLVPIIAFRYYWQTIIDEKLFTIDDVKFIQKAMPLKKQEYSLVEEIENMLKESREVDAQLHVVNAMLHAIGEFVGKIDTCRTFFKGCDKYSWHKVEFKSIRNSLVSDAILSGALEHDSNNTQYQSKALQLKLHTMAEQEAVRLLMLVKALAPPKKDDINGALNAYMGTDRFALLSKMSVATSPSDISLSGDWFKLRRAKIYYNRHEFMSPTLSTDLMHETIVPFPKAFRVGHTAMAPVIPAINDFGYFLPSNQVLNKNQYSSTLARHEFAAAIGFSSFLLEADDVNRWKHILGEYARVCSVLETQMAQLVMEYRERKNKLILDLQETIRQYNWGKMNTGGLAIIRKTVVEEGQSVKTGDAIMMVDDLDWRTLTTPLPDEYVSTLSAAISSGAGIDVIIDTLEGQVVPLTREQKRDVLAHNESSDVLKTLRELTRAALRHPLRAKNLSLDEKSKKLTITLPSPKQVTLKVSELEKLSYNTLNQHLKVIGVQPVLSGEQVTVDLPLGVLPLSGNVLVHLRTVDQTTSEEREWRQLLNE